MNQRHIDKLKDIQNKMKKNTQKLEEEKEESNKAFEEKEVQMQLENKRT